jgi:protease II
LNLNRKATLPNILLQTGNNDEVVPFWGPLKFAAKLRDLRKDTRGMTLVHYSDSGRRGTPDTLYFSDWSYQLAFVLTFVARK